MDIITKLRKLSNSSLGITIPNRVIKYFNLEKGTYKTEVKKKNNIIVIRLEKLL